MIEKSSSELLLVPENEPSNDSNIFHTNSNSKRVSRKYLSVAVQISTNKVFGGGPLWTETTE